MSNPLNKIINRKTVKLSYSCTSNVKQIIQAHNKKVLSGQQTEKRTTCNCRDKSKCPVPSQCCSPTVIYKATVNKNNTTAEYVGSTELDFKLRFNNHNKSFKHENYKSETTLSKYVWDNNLGPTPNIKWEFLKKCNPTTPGRKICDLCISEKFFIITNIQNPKMINKRTDIGNKCPHKRKWMLEDLST